MSTQSVLIELTNRQVDLLLEHSYPFENEEQQLKQLQEKSADFHILKSDNFYGPRLIGDIYYSAKNIDSENLLEELVELGEIIEMAISRSSNKGGAVILC